MKPKYLPDPLLLLLRRSRARYSNQATSHFGKVTAFPISKVQSCDSIVIFNLEKLVFEVMLRGFFHDLNILQIFVRVTFDISTNQKKSTYIYSKNILLCKASSIQRVQFLSTSRVLLYRDTIDRVLFYIEMTVMMSDYPHKVLKLVCQAMVEIFANFVAQVLNKNRGFSFHGKIQILFNTYATKFAKISTIA